MKRLLIAGLIGIAMGLCILVFADFQPEPLVTRNPHIRNMEIRLYRSIEPGDLHYPQGIKFRIALDDQYSQPMGNRNGDLIPHLTSQQIQQLQDFMDMLWQKAENEILP